MKSLAREQQDKVSVVELKNSHAKHVNTPCSETLSNRRFWKLTSRIRTVSWTRSQGSRASHGDEPQSLREKGFTLASPCEA